MAIVPTIDEQVPHDPLILSLEKVALSDEQFAELCANNRELHIELSARKELVIMTLPGGNTGRRNAVICHQLEEWSDRNSGGITFSPSTLFRLQNGATRAPDASWLSKERWNALSPEEQEGIPPVCPDFVLELMSPSDRRPVRFRLLLEKMEEYLQNGARLGWLIDPFDKSVYIYRPGRTAECIFDPDSVSGEPVLHGFVLNLTEIWQG